MNQNKYSLFKASMSQWHIADVHLLQTLDNSDTFHKYAEILNALNGLVRALLVLPSSQVQNIRLQR